MVSNKISMYANTTMSSSVSMTMPNGDNIMTK